MAGTIAKYKPEIGTKMTLVNAYCATATPYTVIGYERGQLIAQECYLYFRGTRYFDSVADGIFSDPKGRTIRLNWCPKYGKWRRDRYNYAEFGHWAHEPYTD